MAKLTDFENPITGKKENLLDFGGMLSKVIGVVVMLFVVATGQNVAKALSGKASMIDTSIDPIINRPIASSSRVSRVL